MIDGSFCFMWNFLTVRWLWLHTQQQRLNCVDVFSRLPRLPGCLLTVPNFTSSLLMLFFVQALLRNFVINCRACDLYIHTDFLSKFCILYWTASKLPCLFDRASKFALFLVSGLKDEKLIKKLTYKKTETCKFWKSKMAATGCWEKM